MSVTPEQYDLIRRPIITEKATLASEHGAVVFEVAMDASKPEIKKAIESLRAYPLLQGARGTKPVDIDALAGEVAKIADVAYRLGDRLEALEINPLRAAADGNEALDALITWAE